MSVLIIAKFQADTAKFRQSLSERADEYAKISEESKAVGGLHHQFGIGDGYVLVVDEWDSVEHFQAFMANPDLQAFIGSVGGRPGTAGGHRRRGGRLGGPVLTVRAGTVAC